VSLDARFEWRLCGDKYGIITWRCVPFAACRCVKYPARKLTVLTGNKLYTIAVVMLILWLLGMITSYTMGGFIHILLVIAIVVVLLRVING
jgi:hypothetical protein